MAKRIGERIKELRNSKELTQAELADKLGFTSQTISNWESGIREPDIDTLSELSSLFNVTLDYLMLGKRDEQSCSMKCPVCGGDRFVKPHNLDGNSKESKVTCIHCGYTFSMRLDVKIDYFNKIKQLNTIQHQISERETELKIHEQKTGDVSRFKKELKELKKKQAMLQELDQDNKTTRGVAESISELEAIILSGKDDNAIRVVKNLNIEINSLKMERRELMNSLRDPFKNDIDILREASDRNVANYESGLIDELLKKEMDKYLSYRPIDTKFQMIKLDDSLIESYEKLSRVISTLNPKPIHITTDAEEAEYILVESDERKQVIGKKAITTKEFGKYWGIIFNL